MPAAQYVRQSELKDAIKARVKSVNDAVWELRQLGILVEMPEKIDMQFIVVDEFNAITRTDTSATDGANVTPVQTEKTEVLKSGETTNENGTQNQTESTNETSNATSADNIANSGADEAQTDYQYQT